MRFTPQAGSVSFEGPGDSGTIIVTYSADSPASGAASVSVDGADAVNHTVSARRLKVSAHPRAG